MLDQEIQQRINEWQSDIFDQETRNEIEQLVIENNEKELIDRFYKDLDFGTGGMRGVLGAGTNRMNIYTVGMAAQGLANYLLKIDPNSKSKGVVIAHDSRRMSDMFTLRSALILAANGIKCYIFKSLRPTPILSFAIRYLKCISGIVVTASHNPPEYNGYKVYYEDGGQVLPPHDKGIINEVRNIKSIKEIKVISEKEAIDKGLLEYLDDSVDTAYYQKALTLALNRDILPNMPQQPKIVFTPLHGTGNLPVRELLSQWGFNQVIVVPDQELPDGNFPTVSYPNPEEAAALKLAIDLAKKIDGDLVLATDPDADRVGIAVRNHNNEFVLLNGNQVGVLLTYYILSELKKENRLPANGLVVKTIVSTDLTNPICEDFQVTQEECLTGFKYIAEKINRYHDLENGSKSYLFGFEESYGYNAGEFVRDKDAVTSCCLIAELAAVCKHKGTTLFDYLDDIYKKYGYYIEGLESLTLKGKEGVEKIQSIITHFRETPPESISGSKVVKIRDVKTGIITDIINNKQENLDIPESNVITFYLENGGKVTMRPSGTEPKIKFYFSFCQKEGSTINEIKTLGTNQLNQLKSGWMKLINSLI